MGFFYFFIFNRTDYRGFPSKGYSIFFQRPREQLTEYNRTLGSAQFQKSSTNVVRTNRFPGRILQCLISQVGSKFNTEAAAEGTARSKRSGLILQTPCRGQGSCRGPGVMQGPGVMLEQAACRVQLCYCVLVTSETRGLLVTSCLGVGTTYSWR